MSKILMPIKPEYVEEILSGRKKYEYRKTKPKKSDIDKMIIYSTFPVMKVVGEVEINEIIEDTPERIWNATENHTGISKESYDLYYKNKSKAIAYTIRMMPRNGFIPEGYFEYTVYPLEGLWDLTEEGRKTKKLNKNELLYTIMIKQPEFVTKEVFEKAFEIANKKKPFYLLNEVYFDEIEDGLSVQMLHVGPYDTEPETFNKMKEFIDENNLEIKTLVHREIYLSDARRVSGDKLRTVLRYQVIEKLINTNKQTKH